jgi:hypothetical protein
VATDPQATLTVQLSKRTNISTATVIRGNTGSLRYNIETSTDGSNWRVVATAPVTSTGTDQLRFARTEAQFVRLDFPGGTSAGAPNIDELSIGR